MKEKSTRYPLSSGRKFLRGLGKFLFVIAVILLIGSSALIGFPLLQFAYYIFAAIITVFAYLIAILTLIIFFAPSSINSFVTNIFGNPTEAYKIVVEFEINYNLYIILGIFLLLLISMLCIYYSKPTRKNKKKMKSIIIALVFAGVLFILHFFVPLVAPIFINL
ncbi:MAG: hypothetical protein RR909_03750 [Bacilli bacterium]